MNVASLIAEVLAYKNPTLAPASRRRYAAAARGIAVSHLGSTDLASVTPMAVARYTSGMRATPNAANHALTVLKIAFDWALERGLVLTNPAASIKRHREAKRTRLLTPAEIDSVRTASGPQLRLIIDLCVHTGQRVGDILALTVDAVRQEGLLVRASKTGKALIVGWTPALSTIVAEAQALPCHERLLGAAGVAAPLYNTVLKRWLRACEASGVRDAHIHDLRAYAATVADRQGLDATALLGHSSPAVTARYLRDRAPRVVAGPMLTMAA